MIRSLFTRLLFLFIFFSAPIYGQDQPGTGYAFPFLTFTPDVRSAALGESVLGSQVFPDYAAGFAASYTPYLRNTAADVHLGYISGFKRLSDRMAIGTSVRYFSFGAVALVDAGQQSLGTSHPNEVAIDGTISRQFGQQLFLSSTIRIVQANHVADQSSTAASFDAVLIFRTLNHYTFGLSVSNIGNTVSRPSGSIRYFLPARLVVGGTRLLPLEGKSHLLFSLEAQRLMIPTKLAAYPLIDMSVPASIVKSFGDAGGFKEELQETGLNMGMEYQLPAPIALRAGVSLRNPVQNYHSYVTLGAGLNLHPLHVDLAYTAANERRNPMGNTLRFGLAYYFGAAKGQ